MQTNETNSSANPEQPANVISDYYEGYQQLELQSAEHRVKKARNAIYAVAALTIIGSLIMMGVGDTFTPEGLIIVLVIAGIFFGLGLFTKKQPLTSIIIALVLYVGLWIFDIVALGAEMIYKGIIVKGIILYFLITGIKHAREAERIRKELQK